MVKETLVVHDVLRQNLLMSSPVTCKYVESIAVRTQGFFVTKPLVSEIFSKSKMYDGANWMFLSLLENCRERKW